MHSANGILTMLPWCSTLQGGMLCVDIVEVHCYVEAAGELILMSIHIRSRINQSINSN